MSIDMYKCMVGDAVNFKYEQYEGDGIVKFVGSLAPNKTGLWIGIERTSPISKDEKKNPDGFNGKLNSIKYFSVKKNKGIFVPYDNVDVINDAITPSKKSSKSIINDQYSPVDDQKIQTDNTQVDTTLLQQQLKKTQKLLESSLLLLQKSVLNGNDVDRLQIKQHCNRSWQFLNKISPSSVSTKAPHKFNGGINDEEKLISHKVSDADNYNFNDDTMPVQQKKIILIDFMNRYSDIKNWKKEGKSEYGASVESFTLKLDKRRVIKVRMSFLYSMILYLIQISGANKRCINHAALLLLTKQQQIEILSKEITLILKTLQFNDDNYLWNYVYDFVSSLFKNFSVIKCYSGKRIDITNKNQVFGSEESETLSSMFKLKAMTKRYKCSK